MLRFLAQTLLEVAANAIGMLIASWLLDGFSINGTAFVIAVLVFTLIKFLLSPLIIKLTVQYVAALRGGIALVTTFISLLITTWISDGLIITGVDGWVIGTLIVWLAGVLAALVLPLFVFKSVLQETKKPDPTPPLDTLQ